MLLILNTHRETGRGRRLLSHANLHSCKVMMSNDIFNRGGIFEKAGCHEQRCCCRQTNISVAVSDSLSMTFTGFYRSIPTRDYVWVISRRILVAIHKQHCPYDIQYLLYTIISFLISRTIGNFHTKFNAVYLFK